MDTESLIRLVPGLACILMTLLYWWMRSSMVRNIKGTERLRDAIRQAYVGSQSAERAIRLGDMSLFLLKGIEATFLYRSGMACIRALLALVATLLLPVPKDPVSAFAMAYIMGAAIPAMMLWDLRGVLEGFRVSHILAYAFRAAGRGTMKVLKGIELRIYGDRECDMLDAELDKACLGCHALAKNQGVAEAMNEVLKVRRSGDK